jgi:hypothetical protein
MPKAKETFNTQLCPMRQGYFVFDERDTVFSAADSNASFQGPGSEK